MVGLMVGAYVVFMFALIPLVFWYVPKKANEKKFRVKELSERGGCVIVNGNRYRVEKGTEIIVGAGSITFRHHGQEARISFNGWTTVMVEVD